MWFYVYYRNWWTRQIRTHELPATASLQNAACVFFFFCKMQKALGNFFSAFETAKIFYHRLQSMSQSSLNVICQYFQTRVVEYKDRKRRYFQGGFSFFTKEQNSEGNQKSQQGAFFKIFDFEFKVEVKSQLYRQSFWPEPGVVSTTAHLYKYIQ